MEVADKIEFVFPEISDIPAEFRLDKEIDQTEYLVNGEIRYWSGPLQDVVSPVFIREGETAKPRRIGSYPMLTEHQAMEALQAAVSAYNNGIGLWPTMPVAERIKCMEEFVRRMKQKRNEMINLLMWEIGKSYKDSEKEFDRTVKYIVGTIEEVKELDRKSSSFMIEEGIIGHIKRSPLGVTLCMGPYNYPLNETFTTLIPAIIMGNTTVFKPPKIGVLVHRPLLEAFRDCFPPGVVNTVYGDGETVVTPLMKSGDVSVLAFIGSSMVASLLKKEHPKPHRLRSCLGLEAKNPGIVLADADLDSAVEECLLGALSYNGQRCTALKILFVHYKIADHFIERFMKSMEEMKMGLPWEDGVQVTPIPDLDKVQYMTELVEDACAHGAQIINPNGGEARGTFFYPAVLSPVNEKMRIYHEEQFGPIIPIVTFADIETPIRYIVESNYGQQVSIFGTDPNKIAELIDPLVNQVSRVNLNSQCQRGPDVFPFTGRKDSAELTLSVSDALRVFSIRTMVAAKNVELNQQIITSIVRDHKSGFLSTDFIF